LLHDEKDEFKSLPAMGPAERSTLCEVSIAYHIGRGDRQDGQISN
jgi:hypothetical protein